MAAQTSKPGREKTPAELLSSAGSGPTALDLAKPGTYYRNLKPASIAGFFAAFATIQPVSYIH